MANANVIEVMSVEEAQSVENTILEAANRSSEWISASGLKGVDLIRSLKYEPIGFHPIDLRPLNLIEQVNQTFTCLAAIKAIEVLFQLHPESAGFRLNMAEQQGSDIESLDGGIAAEVFAAVKPSNNQKLKKDIEKAGSTNANHKYVFFASPGYTSGRHSEQEDYRNPEVQVWAVDV